MFKIYIKYFYLKDKKSIFFNKFQYFIFNINMKNFKFNKKVFI